MRIITWSSLYALFYGRRSQKQAARPEKVGGSQHLSTRCLSTDRSCVGYNSLLLHLTFSAVQEMHLPHAKEAARPLLATPELLERNAPLFQRIS